MRASSFKAIAIGFIIDVAGTVVFSVLALSIYVFYLLFHDFALDEVKQMANGIGASHPVGAISMLVGFGFSFLGGYFCASLSPLRGFRDPLILMALANGSGLLYAHAHYSVIENLLMLIVGCAATLAGARFKMRGTDSDRSHEAG